MTGEGLGRRLAAVGVTAAGLVWSLVALLALAGVWPATAGPRHEDAGAFAELYVRAWLAADGGDGALAPFGDGRLLSAGGGGRYAAGTTATAVEPAGAGWRVTVLADVLVHTAHGYVPSGPRVFEVRIERHDDGLVATAPPSEAPGRWPGRGAPVADDTAEPDTADPDTTDPDTTDPTRTDGTGKEIE